MPFAWWDDVTDGRAVVVCGGVLMGVTGGIVGPVAFVAAWLLCGAATEGYSPVDEAISELAAVGAPTRVAMTTGFVVFSVGVGWFALACRPRLPGWSWLALGLAAAATLGAAIFPLGEDGADFDAAHGAFAGLGYGFLVAAPLLAAVAYRRAGDQPEAIASLAVGVVAAACLLASVSVEANGLFQRLGLTVVDAWIVVLAVAILRNPAAGPGVSPGDGRNG
jgi:hypothetical membrane protein